MLFYAYLNTLRNQGQNTPGKKVVFSDVFLGIGHWSVITGVWLNGSFFGLFEVWTIGTTSSPLCVLQYII